MVTSKRQQQQPRSSLSSSLLSRRGAILVLPAGAPPFCRAENEGLRSVRLAVVVRIMHGSMLSKSTAGDPPIRRANSQAYNFRTTRRKDRVWFDPRTPGHDHGTGHGWYFSYSSC